jgi:hypothetical protein
MSFDAEMIERLCIVGTGSDCAEQIHGFMEAGAEAVCFTCSLTLTTMTGAWSSCALMSYRGYGRSGGRYRARGRK